MGHLLHLMFRCDGDVMFLWGFLRELNRAVGSFLVDEVKACIPDDLNSLSEKVIEHHERDVEVRDNDEEMRMLRKL